MNNDNKHLNNRQLSEDEVQKLLALGQGETIKFDRSKTIVDDFVEKAKLYPDYTAVVDEFSSISYAELDRQSDVLASLLIEKGVKTNDFVALMFSPH